VRALHLVGTGGQRLEEGGGSTSSITIDAHSSAYADTRMSAGVSHEGDEILQIMGHADAA
jgi:hypothetical protein